MDFRYLVIQSIALLFWEARTPEAGIDSKALVKEILKAIPAPESMAGTEEDRENLLVLRDICSRMTVSDEYQDREFLMSKLKLSIKKDNELREDVISVLGRELEDERKLEHIRVLHQELITFFNQRDFKKEIQRIASDTIFAGAAPFKVGEMAKHIVASMERFIDGVANDDEDPMLNGKADTEDLEGLAKVFMNVQEDLSPDSVIKTGWQGFNRMCGETGGLRRGNMYVIGAMPNKGKSLISSFITLHAMMFNTPYLFDKTKKPCVVHFSTENDLMLNMKIWFRYLWENRYHEPCNLQDQDPESMAKWFKEEIEKTGFKFMFYHIDPTNTSYREIIAKLIQIETEHEIHLCTIDYLAMINGDGLGDENRAFWVRQLFKVMRNHCNPRKITLITPHQVSTEAAMYIRQGTDDFVKQIAGKRFWADCRSIDMEVDMEICLNVEKTGSGENAKSWMAFGRGKDRSALNTPEQDKFFFLPFQQIGTLPPDVGGKDTSKRTIRNENEAVIATDWSTPVNGGDGEY